MPLLSLYLHHKASLRDNEYAQHTFLNKWSVILLQYVGNKACTSLLYSFPNCNKLFCMDKMSHNDAMPGMHLDQQGQYRLHPVYTSLQMDKKIHRSEERRVGKE